MFINVENAFLCFFLFPSFHNMTGLHTPQNVKVYSICSTCLRVTWDPVFVPIDENPLTGYRLVCRQEASGKTIVKVVGPTQSSTKLKYLQKFSSYTVTVSSVGKNELGDPSEAVTVTTLEDGKFIFRHLNKIVNKKKGLSSKELRCHVGSDPLKFCFIK